MDKKLPITAVLIIYNEEKILRTCLDSLKLFDEIIVIHDGECGDKSLEIAKEYTDKIFERPRYGACDVHRIFGFEQAKNEWCFIIDADEYLSEELQNNLESLISDESVGIYDVAWPTLYKGKMHLGNYKRVLFQKSKVYFIGVINEYIKPIDENVKIKTIDLMLEHKPNYENYSFEKFKTKQIKWAKRQAKELQISFSELPKWNCPLQKWEKFNQIRLDYPILFGMIGSFVGHNLRGWKKAIKNKNYFFIVQGFYVGCYDFLLYYFYKFK